MPVSRTDVADSLAVCESAELLAVLEAAELDPRGASTPRELAERIADAIWWNYATPLGYVSRDSSLEEIVRHVAKKLRVHGALGDGDAWSQLERLTATLGLSLGPMSMADLTESERARLTKSLKGPVALAAGGGSSFAAGVAGRGILRFAASPVGKLIPYIPRVGPAFRSITRGAGVAATVGTPLAIAMSVLAANSALGANYQRLVPLLLGAGALGKGPVEDAEIVETL
ncbi:MAG: hypothetical protein EP330_30305 [Deltaproteobacteria bacterium]|nr:MAG: hypothetical protein EP330_30305 [Deltaproteobacteria bacterium]